MKSFVAQKTSAKANQKVTLSTWTISFPAPV